MYFRTLIVIVFMITGATSDSVINSCTNTGSCTAASTDTCTAASTGTCNVLGGCDLPSDYNDCIVNWRGVSYLCTSPPAGYYYVAITCNYMVGCTTCSANSLHSPQPVCQWRN
jgi:hypothetical protein